MSRIGLFGGTFDPIHSGHVTIVKKALAEGVVDEVVVIPAAVNPFKVGQAPGGTWDRLLLVRAAFNGFAHVRVDDREMRRGGVSYAIDTVREFAAEHPHDELVFLIGEDSVAGLPRWKDYDELRKLCTFHVYPRTPESSTEVRTRLAEGRPIDDLVPPAVALFLAKKVRYQPDTRIVNVILEGLRRKDGYCPCRIPKIPEYFCPCQEFRGQLADPAWHGLCHCRLYQKP